MYIAMALINSAVAGLFMTQGAYSYGVFTLIWSCLIMLFWIADLLKTQRKQMFDLLTILANLLRAKAALPASDTKTVPTNEPSI